jgi:hypothetical protein
MPDQIITILQIYCKRCNLATPKSNTRCIHCGELLRRGGLPSVERICSTLRAYARSCWDRTEQRGKTLSHGWVCYDRVAKCGVW